MAILGSIGGAGFKTGMILSGDESLRRAINALSKKGARRVLARTVMRGARILAKKAADLAPVDEADLKRSIRAKLIKGKGVVVRVAPRYPDAAHAHLVEFGTFVRPALKGGGKRIANIGGKPVLIDNTGVMPAKPFMRPAFDVYGPLVLREITNDTAVEIEKEAAKEAAKQ